MIDNHTSVFRDQRILVSVIIVALNEEKNIERCLDSVKWADEVIVYDSGSTDRTIELVRGKGRTLISGPWLGFGLTKYTATQQAKHEWILSLDADEEVSDALKIEIEELLKSCSQSHDFEAIGFRVPRLSRFMNRWIRHGGWYPDYQIRFFNKKKSQWNHEKIHEKVICAQVKNLQAPLNHFVFDDISHQVATNNRYSTLQAQQLFFKKKPSSYFKIFVKPFFKFLECYFFKLGFLDGWAGFVIARNASYSMFLKWIKLKELWDHETRKKIES